MFKTFNHVFSTNNIAYFQQNRYVWFAIYTYWFTLNGGHAFVEVLYLFRLDMTQGLLQLQ